MWLAVLTQNTVNYETSGLGTRMAIFLPPVRGHSVGHFRTPGVWPFVKYELAMDIVVYLTEI
jgi:hypothetical protein